MGDRLTEMMERQQAFQERIGGMSVNESQRVSLTKDLILHLISECDELLREISFKSHRRETPFIERRNVVEELVDIQKFLYAICSVWNIPPGEFHQVFEEKSVVVEQRYEQEFPLVEIIRGATQRGVASVVVLDIDGVLADYPFSFNRWVARNAFVESTRFKYDSYRPHEAFEGRLSLGDIKRLKHVWRSEGMEQTCDEIAGAARFTHSLRARGYKVVLVSARPVKRYSRIYFDTIKWLNSLDFAFDALMWDERKEERLLREFEPESIAMFVDDLEHNVQAVADSGIPAMMLRRPYNNSLITFADILNELEVIDES